ncbi:protein kinase [Thiotrichales bacterium 19X7-9]|nr:protein kinase [Thiotrichales bacterium 19X7-9]
MPRIAWDSEKQRNLEWRVALSYLAKAPNGTKIKRARHKSPIDYTDPETQEKVNISHSFIKVNDQIYVMAGEGKYLGEGGYGKVKLCENKNGNIFALKIDHPITDHIRRQRVALRQKKERDIMQDVGIFHGYATIGMKGYSVIEYLGENLDQQQYDLLESQLIGFKCISEVSRLHNGDISYSNTHWLHRDIKPENFVKDENGDVRLIDFGMGTEAGDYAFGKTRLKPMGTEGYMAPEIKSFGEFSFHSDIYALGVSLREILSHDSQLRPIAKQMCAKNPMSRPDLKLAKIAFLAEIHKNSDRDLAEALRNNGCITEDINEAKQLFSVLTDPRKNVSFIKAFNHLQQCLHPDFNHKNTLATLVNNETLQKAVCAIASTDRASTDRFTRSDWRLIRENEKLQKAVCAIASTDRFTRSDWRLIRENEKLQKAVCAIASTDRFTRSDWRLIRENEKLQKAIIVAYESGVDINTSTIDFLNENASVKDTLAQSYDHIESMDTSSESKEAFQKEARSHRNELVEHIIKDSVKHPESDATKSGAYAQLTRLNKLVDKANNEELTKEDVKDFRDNSIKTPWWKSTAAKVVFAAVAVIGLAAASVVTFGGAAAATAIGGVVGGSIVDGVGTASTSCLIGPMLFKSHEEKAVAKVANAAGKTLE